MYEFLKKCGIIFVFLIGEISSNVLHSTTTKAYDLEVPGSNPIRIIEGESLWDLTTPITPISEHRSFRARGFTTNNPKYFLDSSLNVPENERKFSPEQLNDFLNSYAKHFRKPTAKYQEPEEYPEMYPQNDAYSSSEETQTVPNLDKQKSWNLIEIQKHHRPHDDNKGWVSLDPVPWSVSKISKWQNSEQQTESEESEETPSWTDDDYEEEYEKPKKPTWSVKPPSRPYGNYNNKRPESYPNNQDNFYVNRKPIKISTPKPRPNKPYAYYGQKVHTPQIGTTGYAQITPSFYNKPYNNNEDYQQDIMTDGEPPNFPENDRVYDGNRRRGTERYPASHPFKGNGDWVLLSTTRGYKYPRNRQRSMKLNEIVGAGRDSSSSESISTHKTVKLTVLPPLKGSRINMTTSHGGMLQVESTFETVEQAKDKYNKKQKLKLDKKKPNRFKVQKVQKVQKRPGKQQVLKPLPIQTTVTGKRPGYESSAVMAAVGAGLIPATMAMLMPLAINGRRRRDVHLSTRTPTSIEITLPRSIM